MIEIVTSVRANSSLPLAVKLSPFFSSLPHFVAALGTTPALVAAQQGEAHRHASRPALGGHRAREHRVALTVAKGDWSRR